MRQSVNGQDITHLTFDDAMDMILKATWPLTIRFLRDKQAVVFPSEIEGWAAVMYPSLNRKRRRYVELRENELSFRKPAPGGAAMSNRDAFFIMTFVESIHVFRDLNIAEDQYMVRMVCREGAKVNQVDDAGDAMGGTTVVELDLYFKKTSTQEIWAAKLAEALTPSIPISHLTDVLLRKDDELKDDGRPVAIWSELTGRFAARVFFISDGYLGWARPGTSKTKARKVMLADLITCNVISVEAVESTMETSAYKYQILLTLKDSDEKVILGTQDVDTLDMWLGRIHEAITLGPEAQRPVVPSHATRSEVTPKRTKLLEEQSGSRMSMAITNPGEEEEEADVSVVI